MWPWSTIKRLKAELGYFRERQSFLIARLQEKTREAGSLRTEIMVLKARLSGLEGAYAESEQDERLPG